LYHASLRAGDIITEQRKAQGLRITSRRDPRERERAAYDGEYYTRKRERERERERGESLSESWFKLFKFLRPLAAPSWEHLNRER